MSRTLTKFFTFPSTRTKLEHELQKSAILSSLWSTPTGTNHINSPHTLPQEIKPKSEIYKEVEAENAAAPQIQIKFKQSFAYGKSIMNFYKIGVQNVWNNKLEVNKLKKHYKLGKINNKGKEVDIIIPSFNTLTTEMAQTLYIRDMEKRSNKSDEVIKHENVENAPLFNLTRSQYQLLKRTPSDFYKIPLFGVIFMIFMECTPLICYAIPEITPLTCILPSILPRVWNPTATKQLMDVRKNRYQDLADLAVKNAYNLPLDEVRLLCKALRLTSKYIPAGIYPESTIRRRLQDYYNYIKVDNFYLSGMNGTGNIWNLSDAELLLAGLERNLILDIKHDTKVFDAFKDEATKNVETQKYFNNLRLDLLRFIVDFENSNIGYLGVNHLGIGEIQSKQVLEWKN